MKWVTESNDVKDGLDVGYGQTYNMMTMMMRVANVFAVTDEY